MTIPVRSRNRVARLVGKALGGALAAVLLLALAEGLLSFALVAHGIATRTDPILRPRREGLVQFDAELGWSPVPGYFEPAACGPGRPVSTGARGIRGRRPVAREVAADRVRMVVAGDSFSFGSGVADGETWAMGLEAREPRLETVNVAVGGFGVDQAFLRYRRDAADLEHQLALFGFITEDLRRMVVATEWGAEKPRLVVKDGELEVTGVPVRRVEPLDRFLRQAGTQTRQLRLSQAIERFAGLERDEPQLASDASMIELTRVVLRELHELAAARGAHPVVLHLPVESERSVGGSIDSLAPLLAAEVRALGGSWIDLLAEFRALDSADHAALFLRKPEPSAGHYNVAGCARVAGWLHAKLRADARVARRLDGAE